MKRESLLLFVILGSVFFSTFNFLSFVLDTWKEYKEYREANSGPRTLKSFHTRVRFGRKDRPKFVWKEKMDVKRIKRKSTFKRKKKIKMIKMTIRIFGIG